MADFFSIAINDSSDLKLNLNFEFFFSDVANTITRTIGSPWLVRGRLSQEVWSIYSTVVMTVSEISTILYSTHTHQSELRDPAVYTSPVRSKSVRRTVDASFQSDMILFWRISVRSVPGSNIIISVRSPVSVTKKCFQFDSLSQILSQTEMSSGRLSVQSN